jgi:hypothetical protein
MAKITIAHIGQIIQEQDLIEVNQSDSSLGIPNQLNKQA